MHQNYHFLQHLAPALNKNLAGKYFIEAFSQEKDELLMIFDEQNDSDDLTNPFFIKATLRSDFSSLSFPEKFDRARRNSVNLFTDFNSKRIESVRVFENERALKMLFTNGSSLVFKLFGNRSNLFGFDPDGEIMTLFNRKLVADKSLKADSFHRKIDQSFEQFVALEGHFEKLFPTFGKLVNQYLHSKMTETTSLEEKWEVVNKVLEEMKSGKFYLSAINHLPSLNLLGIGEDLEVFDDPILALNQFYLRQVRLNGIDKEKGEIVRVLRKRIVQTKSYLHNTFQKLVLLEEAVKNDEIGHIIMANLQNIPPRSESVELFDFYRDVTIKIKLKKDLSPQKNAENYYRKSKNEKIEIDRLNESLSAREAELLKIENHLAEVENIVHLRELRSYIKQYSLLGGKASVVEVGELFKKFIFMNFTILIGRNAKNNDLLTKQYAHKDDLWLHARDVSGSHVVIKHQAGRVFPQPVIERAAEVAAFYSKRRTDTICPVIVTPKKYVRKPKGMPDGAVILDKESVIMVAPHDEF